MVCLIHWAILYDFGSRHFSFNPSPFYNRLLSERGLFWRVSCTRGVSASMSLRTSIRPWNVVPDKPLTPSLPNRSPKFFRILPDSVCRQTGRGVCSVCLPLPLRSGDISLLRRKVVTPGHPDKVHCVLHLVLPMSCRGITFSAAQRKMFHLKTAAK